MTSQEPPLLQGLEKISTDSGSLLYFFILSLSLLRLLDTSTSTLSPSQMLRKDLFWTGMPSLPLARPWRASARESSSFEKEKHHNNNTSYNWRRAVSFIFLKVGRSLF